MKLKLLGLVLVALLFITACGTDSSSTEGLISLENLPRNIDVSTAASLIDNEEVVFIDVREQWEYDEGHIPGVTLIPVSEVENRLAEIPTDKIVVLTCRSGNRSGRIHALLKEQGYDNTTSMDGGILAWETAGFAVER